MDRDPGEAVTRLGTQLTVASVALVVAVYFALQVLATTVRLVLLGLAALVAISAYRAWSGERRDRTPTPAPRRR